MKNNWFNIWLVAIILCSAATVSADQLETRITISSSNNSAVAVAGTLSVAQERWLFIDSYASADNLAARISDVKFFDEGNAEISFINSSINAYETRVPVKKFSYRVKLDFPNKTVQAAHVSWLTKERGLLMLIDLLPDFGNKIVSGKVNFNLPPAWKISTSENKLRENEFETANLSRSIFLVGDFYEQNLQLEKTSLSAASVGEWSFTNDEMLEFARIILAAHQKVCGALSSAKIHIILIPFEQKFGGEQWEAETRGSTIVLLAAQIPFKSRALSRLHEQLRHELFHLWLPNSLNLTGDYAWFYEGFTIYQALKTGVRLKYIRFEDYLDVLSRAFDAARQNSNNKNLNLLDASRLRWRGDFSEFVSAKGMTVAFLCDLALLQKSGGGKSLDSVFKELFRSQQFTNRFAPNANQIILGLLKQTPELKTIVEKYVETSNAIDWSPDLAAAGLTNVSKISLTRLAISDKLNRRQKNILAQLGSQNVEN